MTHTIGWTVVALAGFALAPPPAAGDGKAGKETYDDKSGELKTVADGKETVKKLPGKRSLHVRGHFEKDGFHLDEVYEDGPATKLTTVGMGEQPALLEKGDIIAEVDGKKVTTAAEYVAALDGAKDAGKVAIKVIDVNTNMPMDFTAAAAERK